VVEVKIRITFECDDRLRRAVAAQAGRPGLASREEMEFFFSQNGVSSVDDVIDEFEQSEESPA